MRASGREAQLRGIGTFKKKGSDLLLKMQTTGNAKEQGRCRGKEFKEKQAGEKKITNKQQKPDKQDITGP